MNATTEKKRVLCPVEGKGPDKKTFWMRMGIAYVNKDGSINLYLDALPTNGKLQVREWDEDRDRRDTQPQLPRPPVIEQPANEIPF